MQEMPFNTEPLHMASVRMENGVPVSEGYDDVYFSKAGALEESRYVFLGGNRLRERFASAKQRFTVAETGFGTGLNFLLCWQLWDEVAPSGATLHYISIEKHPLDAEILEQVYVQWPSLQHYTACFRHIYPLPVAGAHELWFADGRVRLTLLYGDVVKMLPRIASASVDSWFLDGFSPAKNPHMWGEGQLAHIGRCSTPGGMFATFSAARTVRDGLMAVGFEVERTKGYGHKRHMLVGRMPVDKAALVSSKETVNDVIVIGAGIAGASVAHACVMRGLSVSMVDRHPQPACESSGNPAGILYPFMARTPDTATQFYLRGLAHTVRLLKSMDVRYGLCGMEHRPKDAGNPDALQRLQETAAYVPDCVAYATSAGIYMPCSGWVDVPSLCQLMLTHPRIHCLYKQSVAHVKCIKGVWHAYDEYGSVIAKAGAIVTANAYDARQLWSEHTLPMRRIRGQITYVPERYLHPMLHVYCYGGYVTPAIDGTHYLGATFEKERDDLTIDMAGHEQNLRKLQLSYPDSIKQWPPDDALGGRVAFRTVSADRFPIVGQLYDHQVWSNYCATTVYTKKAAESLETPLISRAYMSIAHGARGLVSAPLAGLSLIHI